MEIIIDKLKVLKEEFKNVRIAFNGPFLNIMDRLSPIVIKAFGSNSEHEEKLVKLLFRISQSSVGVTVHERDAIINYIDIMIDELELSDTKSSSIKENRNAATTTNNNNIFIVHGHNNEMKASVARAVQKLGLNPIILHEQPNGGDTLIEKFTRNSNVGFAIVLLSADDYGYTKKESSENAKFRTRQNVVFELGFFTGKLGRSKVAAIFENIDNFEKPSDIDGVAYIPYDGESWQFNLAKELFHAGYKINLNDLVTG
jgi:predicted nucleotide-binding protein